MIRAIRTGISYTFMALAFLAFLTYMMFYAAGHWIHPQEEFDGEGQDVQG